jgi:hypothetical protein
MQPPVLSLAAAAEVISQAAACQYDRRYFVMQPAVLGLEAAAAAVAATAAAAAE